MNVLFSSDNNYAQHLGVAIYSLLCNNHDESQVVVYVVDNDIQPENIFRLKEVVSVFTNASIEFIPFAKWKDSLHLNLGWPISLSSYARLFVASMLPMYVDKVIYLDCDMIITASLHELWNYNLGDNIIAAVQDAVSDRIKNAVGLRSEDLYFNAGMLLIDLKSWRAKQYEKKCIDFISNHNGQVTHHDQGVLNGVFRNVWTRLPIKYNVMTIHYFFNLRQINKYFENHSDFYSKDEIEEAKKTPAILHFTPSFTTRPWVKSCKHPKKQYYWQMLSNTPWLESVPEKDLSSIAVRFINWRYRKLPF